MTPPPAAKANLQTDCATKAPRKPGRKGRFDDLVAKITKVAVDLGPGQKLPGVYDLRDLMGVSVATLTSALDELEARRVIVRRPGIGIFASPNAGKRVISLVCDPTFFRSGAGSPFWNMLITQARTRADSQGELLDLHFASITGDTLALPAGLIADIVARRITGVLYVGTFPSGVEWIESHSVPVVVFAGPGSHTVSVDDTAMIRHGAEALARRGCKRIAFGAPDERVTTYADADQFRERRLTAFKEGVESGGRAFIPGLVRDIKYDVAQGAWMPDQSAQEVGYRTALDWFNLPRDQRPDGVVVTEDLMTLGVLTAAQESGLEIGQDVVVATHANVGSSVLIGWEDKMVTVTVDPSMIAGEMFGMLEDLVRLGSTPDCERRILPTVRVGPRIALQCDGHV